jgi:tetratricopeptide (TPR) repeat protein
MVKQKRLLVAMFGLLFSALFLVGCCCCYEIDGTCPPECSCCKVCVPATPAPAAPYWANQIDAGNNAEVIQETTEVIQAGEEAPQYAQALLYRGVAEFNLGDLESAQDDLASAQDLSDRMSKDEQLRLFRTQMMVLAKLGDKTGAEQAFQKALTLAPADQQDEIRSEYENALNP